MPVFIVVAIATQTIRPISGQGWTYQSIGEGWMSDAAMEKEEEIHDYRFISYKCEYNVFVSQYFLSVCQTECLSLNDYVCLSFCLSVCLFICLIVYPLF